MSTDFLSPRNRTEDGRPIVKVTQKVVDAAKLEVELFKAAGFEEQIDPNVLLIANAQKPKPNFAKKLAKRNKPVWRARRNSLSKVR